MNRFLPLLLLELILQLELQVMMTMAMKSPGFEKMTTFINYQQKTKFSEILSFEMDCDCSVVTCYNGDHIQLSRSMIFR